jgi:diguanylate cyclase (GGDEF)-like protein
VQGGVSQSARLANAAAFPHKTRLLLWLSLILIAGFLTTSILSYYVSLNAIRSSITDQALPLTGDNVYSEIQKAIVRPIFISSQMASNTFLRDWLIAGEPDQAQVVRYLQEVKREHNTITAFVISEKTRNYYYAEGLQQVISEDDPFDKWFFRVREMTEAYETNVDPDAGNNDTLTVFINYRVLDYDGKFIGVTGVGLTLENVRSTIETAEQRFSRRIYFVDKTGKLVLTGASMDAVANTLQEMPGIQNIAPQILAGDTTPLRLDYRLPKRFGFSTVQVNSRFIPELNWYLVVEQDDSAAVKPLRTVLFVNLGVSALATLLVLALTLPTIRRYQKRLEKAASTDVLTGLVNRQAFDFLFAANLKDSIRKRTNFSSVLFDIDSFKAINDQHGHLAGDAVIQKVAELARSSVRSNDIVSRWGGEEFMVLLKDCELPAAQQIAENIRAMVERYDFGLGKPVTVSLGVAMYAPNESTDGFFTRTDQALYKAKQNGRNRLEVAV